MNSFFVVVLLAISLSMDAFSLALAYGIEGINNRNKIILSLTVGIYHFIMPSIGLLLANIITNNIMIDINILGAIILFLIGIDLIVSKEKENKLIFSILGILLFGLTVSLDSLSIGISIKTITNNYLGSFLLFAIFSFLFTYLGLYLGNMINQKIGIYSKFLGGIILIIIGIKMLMK